MRIRILALMLVFMLLLNIGAFASEPRTDMYSPKLSFSGTTANCSIDIRVPNSDIDVTLTLYRGWSVIDSWSGSGTHYVKVSGSTAVKDGLEYRLVATGTVDGVAFTSAEIVGTC